MLYFRPLVAGFPPHLPGFDSKFNHVRFVVDKVALGTICLEHNVSLAAFREEFSQPCLFSLLQQILVSWQNKYISTD
jgi:hypothetical protein